jgi:hypothetical protein
MADALAAVTWHLNEYVHSNLSGFPLIESKRAG